MAWFIFDLFHRVLVVIYILLEICCALLLKTNMVSAYYCAIADVSSWFGCFGLWLLEEVDELDRTCSREVNSWMVKLLNLIQLLLFVVLLIGWSWLHMSAVGHWMDYSSVLLQVFWHILVKGIFPRWGEHVLGNESRTMKIVLSEDYHEDIANMGVWNGGHPLFLIHLLICT